NAGNSRCANVLALRSDLRRPLLPVLSAIGRAKYGRRRGRAASRKHDFRIDRIDGQCPEIVGIERRIDELPVHSRILAAIEPFLRARDENVGLARVHGNTTHRGFVSLRSIAFMFSSRWRRDLLLGIGMMPFPCIISQANASCAGVAPFSLAICSNWARSLRLCSILPV